MSMRSQRERRRKYHTRSRTGCNTCKTRHIRCGEEIPICRSCLVTGRECEYLNKPPSGLQGAAIWDLEQTRTLNTGILSAATSDPFDTLPSQLSNESNFLLGHFNNYRVLVFTPPRRPPGGEMSTLILDDKAYLHASLLLAAYHLIRVGENQQALTPLLYYHKGETIRRINEVLDNPVMAVRDGILSAIGVSTILEGISGSPQTATLHLSALQRLVKLRADLDRPTMSPLLQRIIILSDLHASSPPSPSQQNHPISPHQTHPTIQSACNIDKAQDILNPRSPIPTYTIDPSFFHTENGLDPEATKIFLNLHYLSHLISSPSTPPEKNKQLEIRIKDTETHLNTLIHDITYKPPLEGIFRGSRTSVAIAGTIYLYAFLRQVPPENGIFDWMTKLLKEDLAGFGERIQDVYPGDLLLWMLVVGAGAARDEGLEAWFLERLRECRGRGGQGEDWGEVRGILGKFAWRDVFFKQRYVEMWNKITRVGLD